MTLTGNNVITLRKFTSKVTAEKVYPLNLRTSMDTILIRPLVSFFCTVPTNKKQKQKTKQQQQQQQQQQQTNKQTKNNNNSNNKNKTNKAPAATRNKQRSRRQNTLYLLISSIAECMIPTECVC